MSLASDNEYQAAITGLNKFQKEVGAAKTAMAAAAKDCEDNMSGDAHMAKARSSLNKALKALDDACTKAGALVTALQTELEDIHNAGSAIDGDED